MDLYSLKTLILQLTSPIVPGTGRPTGCLKKQLTVVPVCVLLTHFCFNVRLFSQVCFICFNVRLF